MSCDTRWAQLALPLVEGGLRSGCWGFDSGGSGRYGGGSGEGCSGEEEAAVARTAVGGGAGERARGWRGGRAKGRCHNCGRREAKDVVGFGIPAGHGGGGRRTGHLVLWF